LARRLLLASAGAGKSQEIAEAALQCANEGRKALLLTYTINNQQELVGHICRINKFQPRNITIKGWFSFLLEDMVRPYQRCILRDRVAGIVFNQSNPHLIDGRFWKNGTKEAENGNGYNPRHYVTNADNSAHTYYLAKLATRIHEVTNGKPARRLSEIYGSVFVDEVQDLVGWDFEVLKAIAAENLSHIECVGDFRQSIYQTSETTKQPQTSAQKLTAFGDMGFDTMHKSISWRCIQSICDIADRLHAGDGHYQSTKSQATEIPPEFAAHNGVFAVPTSKVKTYLDTYKPIILRWSRASGAAYCTGRAALNFGEAKGLGFDRVLIIPTDKHAKFLGGDTTAFTHEKTDDARNKLYVGLTRARYSVGFVHKGGTVINGAQVWNPGD
jgi:DNA helicase II / ATP-dependent DNA helicase PcrA